MDPHHDPAGADEPPAILDRRDAGPAWSRAWALAALALIGLMLVRACVAVAPVEAPLPPTAAPTAR